MKEVSLYSVLRGTIEAPSSKSYAQRAIVASLLCNGTSKLNKMVLCDDTEWAMKVANSLGGQVKKIDDTTYEITGGISYKEDGDRLFTPRTHRLHVGESGLSARMFTPVASLCTRAVTIEGEGTLLERPMDLMVEPLRQLGVEVDSNNGKLPVRVKGPLLGGEADVDGSVSSQFLSGLLLALPMAEKGTTIHVSVLNSRPYIDMTLEVLEEFGITVDHSQYLEYYIEGNQEYIPQNYTIEGDWSAAAAMLVAGAIAGEVTVNNLNPLSKQADVAILRAVVSAGAQVLTDGDSVRVSRKELKGFKFDATHSPDLIPVLVALAANCEGKTTIKGTNRLKYKESDRAEALFSEFIKMGIQIDLSVDDQMTITGGEIKGATVSSHDDHRVVMSTAVAALRSDEEVMIEGADAVNKSYPNFWRDLHSLKVKE